MDAAGRIDVIRELCSFERRLAGTDAERRAANRLAERLRDGGRRAEVEPTYVHPQYGLVHATHCLLGFAGSLTAIAQPAVGFGLVLVAALSMYLDLNYRTYLIRRLFFRRASQNVVSPAGDGDAPARLVLCAHYDAARTGAVFKPKRIERGARLAPQLPVPIGPFRILFWSLAFLLPVLGARMAGVDSGVVSVLQLPPTLILLVAIFALVDIELSAVAPGANDNASGVATVLSLADDLAGDPAEHLDVWVLFTGAEECLQEGMRAFVRAHRRDLDRATTHFLCIDAVGQGFVRYEAAAGWVVTYSMGPRLVELCDAIAEADEDGRFGARPVRHGLASDAMPPTVARYSATSIRCLVEPGVVPGYHTLDDVPERIDPESLDRAHDFALELIRLLDRDVGRRAQATAIAA